MSLDLSAALTISSALFCIGVYGILSRQNIIVLLMCLELMLNAVNLALISFGRAFLGESTATVATGNTPQVFVVMVLAVAAAEAAVGLSILLAVFRTWRSTNAGEIDLLKG
ncbi:MAG: NADH-quinone oxidoreductase subunit NuoK [Planctomycetota bacterium]|nr:NADH-quinone oxidoreductase subunit NuoK [Planctomycetota bacterium]